MCVRLTYVQAGKVVQAEVAYLNVLWVEKCARLLCSLFVFLYERQEATCNAGKFFEFK